MWIHIDKIKLFTKLHPLLLIALYVFEKVIKLTCLKVNNIMFEDRGSELSRAWITVTK